MVFYIKILDSCCNNDYVSMTGIEGLKYCFEVEDDNTAPDDDDASSDLLMLLLIMVLMIVMIKMML